MIVLLLSILIPVFIGFLLCHLLWQPTSRSESPFWIKAYLSVGLGLGISSCCFFLWLLFLKPDVKSFIILEFVIIAMLLLVYSVSSKRNISRLDFSQEASRKSGIYPIIVLTFVAVLLIAAYVFVCFSLENPHGDWDAWGIWNSRARFIFRGNEQWRGAFSGILHWSHPDYPLLVPGVIARCWKYIGDDPTIIPILISALFTLSTAGLLISSILMFRDKSQALLAGMILLGTPLFIIGGASQYADVPLSFFILSSMVLFCFKDFDEENRFGLLVLAGMMAGLAAWTKNEGMLFLVAAAIAHFVSVILTKNPRDYLRESCAFVIGVAPVLAIILYFKTQIAAATDLFVGQSSEVLFQRLIEPSRYLAVGAAFIKRLFWFGNGLFMMLILYRILVGENLQKIKAFKTNVIMQIITLSLMFIGYFLVYVITPFDLPWHLSTSLNRLLLHLWPSFIFMFFLIMRSPEDLEQGRG